jgi:hypothetical protein
MTYKEVVSYGPSMASVLKNADEGDEFWFRVENSDVLQGSLLDSTKRDVDDDLKRFVYEFGSEDDYGNEFSYTIFVDVTTVNYKKEYEVYVDRQQYDGVKDVQALRNWDNGFEFPNEVLSNVNGGADVDVLTEELDDEIAELRRMRDCVDCMLSIYERVRDEHITGQEMEREIDELKLHYFDVDL